MWRVKLRTTDSVMVPPQWSRIYLFIEPGWTYSRYIKKRSSTCTCKIKELLYGFSATVRCVGKLYACKQRILTVSLPKYCTMFGCWRLLRSLISWDKRKKRYEIEQTNSQTKAVPWVLYAHGEHCLSLILPALTALYTLRILGHQEIAQLPSSHTMLHFRWKWKSTQKALKKKESILGTKQL